MDNGHPWASVQNYTLSEIGVFLKVIVRKEAREKSERITQVWLGSNLKYKALQNVLKEILDSVKPPPTPEEEDSEIQKNWIKIASIMKGQR